MGGLCWHKRSEPRGPRVRMVGTPSLGPGDLSLLPPALLRMGRGLAGETPAEPKYAVLELASFLNAEVSVTKIILEALEA
jgi:hypothetical protein